MESQDKPPRQNRHGTLNALLFWLALVPLIMGSMFFCGQLALLVVPGGQSADTRSRLDASYMPWAYDLIPPINIAAIMKDILKDEQSMGTPVVPVTVVTGVFWEPPTPTTLPGAISTGTPYIPTITLTPQPPQVTPSAAATMQATGTSVPTATATLRPTATPTRTLIPTLAPTRTATQPPPPNATNTAPPPPSATPTNTQVPATPTTPAATSTPTVPTATPVVPTNTVVPTVKPVYSPVLPMAGISEPIDGGCRASFGYRNDNPQEVDIPMGPLNVLSDENATVSPGQPTHFQMGEVSQAFSVVWNSGGQIIWMLDGRSAAVSWCQP